MAVTVEVSPPMSVCRRMATGPTVRGAGFTQKSENLSALASFTPIQQPLFVCKNLAGNRSPLAAH